MKGYPDTREKNMISNVKPTGFDWLLIMLIGVVAAAAGIVSYLIYLGFR